MDGDDDTLMQFWDVEKDQDDFIASLFPSESDNHHHTQFQTQTVTTTTGLHYSEGSEFDDDDEPPTCNLQEVDSWTTLLDLKLTNSEVFRILVQHRVRNHLVPAPDNVAGSSHQPTSDAVPAPNNVAGSSHHHHQTMSEHAVDNVGSSHEPHSRRHQPMSEKQKASNFPIASISIGPWERVSKREGELTAKVYFAKKKLVWEFLDGELKSKIEVAWSSVIAIKALTPPNHPGTLQIQLDSPPSFFRELKPLPRKHTNWQQASDFTGGHASVNRRHYVSFPPRALDIHIDRLLQYDQRLFELSRKPFPSLQEEESLVYFNNVNPAVVDHNVMPVDDYNYYMSSQLPVNFTGGGGVVDEQSIHVQPQFQQYYPNQQQLMHACNPTPILSPFPPLHDHQYHAPLDPIMTAVVESSDIHHDHDQTWDQTNYEANYSISPLSDIPCQYDQSDLWRIIHCHSQPPQCTDHGGSFGTTNYPQFNPPIQNYDDHNPNNYNLLNTFGLTHHVDQVPHHHINNAPPLPLPRPPPPINFTLQGSNNCYGDQGLGPR